MSATEQDCPCCEAKGGKARDADMVVAFVGGYATRLTGTKIEDALCEKHLQLARECIAFMGLAVGSDR